jgi:hypothetical protein
MTVTVLPSAAQSDPVSSPFIEHLVRRAAIPEQVALCICNASCTE